MKNIFLSLTVLLFILPCTNGYSGDSDSWTIPVPVKYDTSSYDLADHRQPGSRLFYISNSGNNPSSDDSPTGQIYYWDGSNIVDSSGNHKDEFGQPYGNDPLNPSGKIKPYKSWVYVAPRRTSWGIARAKVGAAWDGTHYTAPGRGEFREGFPDWWLFKRGDTFDLQAEYLSFAQQTSPLLTETRGGSLAVPGGKSASEIQVVGAYGDMAKPRPRFINPNSGHFINAGSSIKHAAYLSLHFDGRGTNSETVRGINFTNQTNESVNVLLEDIWLDALGGNSITSAMEITLKRILVTDSFNKPDERNHVQGLYTRGTQDSRIRIEESIFLRNGFKHGDPKKNWPPEEEQTWNIFSRNLYLSGECNHEICGVFDTVSMLGASGDQFRPGMRIERNFFFQGYVTMGASGGYPDSAGSTGAILDNVLLRFKGYGTNDNRGQPGFGMKLTSGANKVEVANNIVTSAYYPGDSTSYGFSLDNLSWYCYDHHFKYATRHNLVYDNIFDSGNANSAVTIIDGSGNESDYDCGPALGIAGTLENNLINNILINGNKNISEYVWKPNTDLIQDSTVYVDNRVYKTRSEAGKDLAWVDPDRTLKSYLQSIGVTVESDDGFIEFFNEAIKQRKGYWREEYTARPIVNYFREGFGQSLLHD